MEMRIRAASNKNFNTKNARFIWITFTVFTYFLKLENVDCVDFQWIDKQNITNIFGVQKKNGSPIVLDWNNIRVNK